jgi:predicted nucleic acid-binding protein
MEEKIAVIDTNVLAYYLLGVEPYSHESSNLFEADIELIAPESFKAELLNVMWLSVRNGAISVVQGIEKLNYAEVLIDESVPITALWEDALVLAAESNHSPYDTLFVALAEREKTKLLSFDLPLRDAFPSTVMLPRHFKVQ